MKRYVVGFMFDDTMRKVALILKNRPEWQKGLLNGIGGHIEGSEMPFEAMIREFKEEAGVETAFYDWHHFVTLRFPYAEVEFFAAKNSTLLAFVETKTDEEVGVYWISGSGLFRHIDGNRGFLVIENIVPLIELAKQRLAEREGFAPTGAA